MNVHGENTDILFVFFFIVLVSKSLFIGHLVQSRDDLKLYGYKLIHLLFLFVWLRLCLFLVYHSSHPCIIVVKTL